MNAWFSNLAPRERLMVGAGVCIAAILIVWGFVWTPLQNAALELDESVGEKRNLLVDLQRAEALPRDGAAPVPRGDSGQSLVVLVDSTAQSMGLGGSFTRTRPDGADAINVSFQNAPFDNILDWLVMLERNYGITVESASFNGARERGLVSGQLFLSRS